MEETKIFDKDAVVDELVKDTVIKVSKILEEKGYNPIKQLKGYILSGDLGYITSHKQARNMIAKIEINDLLEVLLKDFIK